MFKNYNKKIHIYPTLIGYANSTSVSPLVGVHFDGNKSMIKIQASRVKSVNATTA